MTRYDEVFNGIAHAEKEECVLFEGAINGSG